MSSAISSLSQSISSEVEGFFFRPGTLRASKKISSASLTSSLLDVRDSARRRSHHRLAVGET
jgi:hypothetical protein